MKSLLLFFAALSSLVGQTSLPTPSETLLWDLQDRAQASGAVWTTAQFETWPGAVYTLQSSSDLETWQPLQSFYALSNQLDLGLFEKEPSSPSNDPSPPLPPLPSNEPIPNASFFLRPSIDGTFTTVSFPSPVDGVLVYQTLPAPLVAEWDSQPFYMDERSGHFLFVAALLGSPAVNFQVTTLLPEEEPYFDALANNFAQIQAQVVSNAATAAANPIVPPPPNPHAKRFYRLERSFPDSDYDGIPDWIEFLTAGMDAFNPDSDGDGSDDGIDSDLDTDGDGLNNSEEALFGTNPLKPDSDGDGILDPQDAAPVFVSITRQAAYDYEDYLPEDNPIKNLTTSANWPTATATSETLSALIPYHQLAGTLASKQSFPATFPAGVLDKNLQAGGTAETLPPPPGFCYHVEKLTHRQIIALAPSAVPYERKFPYLIVTKRTINGEVQTPAITPGSSLLIIPATEKKSQTVELAPSFLNSGENSEESTENYNETVTATLLPVEIRVRQDAGHTGPHGSGEMYTTPRPANGDVRGELFSLWPDEPAFVTIGGDLADLIEQGKFPANTIQWSSPGLANMADVKEYPVIWPDTGIKVVTLNVAGSEFKIRFNVPDVGDRGRSDVGLIADVGLADWIICGTWGESALAFVQQLSGEAPKTGGTKQDAIRHSTWNLMSASEIGLNDTITVTTGNEYTGKIEASAFSSNSTMDLHNNLIGALEGSNYFSDEERDIDILAATTLMQLFFADAKLNAWTPPQNSVSTHHHMIRKSDQTTIYPE